MNFFQEFITDICSIGNEFKDRIMNIPNRGAIVMQNLPTALTGFIVVLSMLAIIAIVILVFSKVMYALSKKKEAKETVWETGENSLPATSVSAGTPLADGNSMGKLDLVDVKIMLYIWCAAISSRTRRLHTAVHSTVLCMPQCLRTLPWQKRTASFFMICAGKPSFFRRAPNVLRLPGKYTEKYRKNHRSGSMNRMPVLRRISHISESGNTLYSAQMS